jgi:hypothetical protein
LKTREPAAAARKNIERLNKNLYQTKPYFLNLNSTEPTADITAAQKGFKIKKATIITGKFIEVLISVIELKNILILLITNKENNKKVISMNLKSNKFL